MRRNLRLLWAAQFVSLLGDGLYLAVIVNYALAATGGSKGAAGAVAACENLPYVALGLWAGVLVDRFDRRRFMMAADLLRAGVLAALYALDRSGWVAGLGPAAVWPICAAAAAVTVGAVFFNPARDALIPELAEGGDLARANASVAVSQHAAQLLGPLLAAGVLAARPLAEAFLWDALTFAGSFACLALMRLPGAPTRPAREGVDVRGALRYVAARGDLRALLVLTALNNLFIMGPAMVGSVLLVNDVAARGGRIGTLSPPAAYGVYLAVFSAGMIAGSLAVGRLKVPGWRLLVAGIALDGLTFLPFEGIAARASFPPLLAALFLHACAVPLIVVVRPGLVQRHVPDGRLGQVFGLLNLTVFGTTALSAALAGTLAAAGVPPGRLFTLAGAGGALCGILALGMRPLRALD